MRPFRWILLLALLMHSVPAGEPAAPPVKSAKKAMALSLLVPGAGEYYLGYKRTGAVFFTAEVCMWLGFTSLRLFGTWRDEDARGWAALNAGVDLDRVGDDDEFFKTIGQYESLDDYQIYKNDDDPDYSATEGTYWEWSSESDQENYLRLRRERITSWQRASQIGGALVLTRLVSALNALRMSRAGVKQMELRSRTAVTYDPVMGRTAVVFIRRF